MMRAKNNAMCLRHRTLFLGALFGLASSCSNSSSTGPVTPPPPVVFAAYAEPAWHPLDRSIIFNHTPLVRYYQDPSGRFIYEFDEAQSGIWMIRIDGSDQHRILPFTLNSPQWNPAGTSVAFSQGASVWTLSGTDSTLDEASLLKITGAERAFAPTWSPDGGTLAFSIHSGPAPGLYVVASTGGESRQVGQTGWRHPSWAPDGQSFAFVSQESTRLGVAIADTAGQGYLMLWGNRDAYASFPRWSPDGTEIAFTGRAGNGDRIELWLMGADGSGARRLTNSGVQDFFSWVPGGEEIAYVRYDRYDNSLENGTIWVVDLNTGVSRQLTQNTPSN